MTETKDKKPEPKRAAKKEEGLGYRNAIVLLLTVIVLVTISVFVYKQINAPKEEQQSQLTYNYFEFNKIEGMWHTNWQRHGQVYDIGLRFSPLEVENVSVTDISLAGEGLNLTFKKLPQYITFDPGENKSDLKYIALGVGELGLNLVRGLGGRIEMACTVNGSDACLNHSIVTCDSDKGVYLLRTAENPAVILAGNCVIIEGKELDLIRAIDRILYTFYGIIA
jgi:hypothetical protein